MESDMKRLNKGIPAGVLMNSGYNSNALAGDFDAILNGWRKAVVAQSQPKMLVSGQYEDGHWVELRCIWNEAIGRYEIDPKLYEAKGRKATMAGAQLALADVRSKTPAAIDSLFEGTIDCFDGGYDWDWKRTK
jgi:hypothetical protein